MCSRLSDLVLSCVIAGNLLLQSLRRFLILLTSSAGHAAPLLLRVEPLTSSSCMLTATSLLLPRPADPQPPHLCHTALFYGPYH